MPEEPSTRERKWDTAIVIALIGVIGTLGVAFLNNIDKIFPHSSAVVQAPASPAGGSASPPPNVPESAFATNMGPLMMKTNLQGHDFSPNPERVESPEACSRLCGETKDCKAMTYVMSPNNIPGGDCWLKTIVPKPEPIERPDMISAIKSGN
jgi:hypothetical protein